MKQPRLPTCEPSYKIYLNAVEPHVTSGILTTLITIGYEKVKEYFMRWLLYILSYLQSMSTQAFTLSLSLLSE